MSNKKAVKPNWIEKDISNMDDWQLLELFSQNILVLDSKNNSIYLFSTYVKLSPQEYKFLHKILKQNGRKITAKDLMESIGAKCDSTNSTFEDYSYAIENSIKSKIIKAFNKRKNLSEKEFEELQALKKAKKKGNNLFLKEKLKKREQARLIKYKNKTYYAIPALEDVDWLLTPNDNINNDDRDTQNISTIDYGDYIQEIDLSEYLKRLIYCKNKSYKAFWPFSVKKC